MTQFGVRPSLHSDFFEPVPPIVVPAIVSRRVLRFSAPPAQVLCDPAPTRSQRILRMTCALFGITKAELGGGSQTKFLVDARTYAAIRLRDELNMPAAVIGRLLGDRDHTTILNLFSRARGLDKRGRPRR